MAGEKNLTALIQGMTPKLNTGEYVFCTVKDVSKINRNDTICEFKEAEGTTIIMNSNTGEITLYTYRNSIMDGPAFKMANGKVAWTKQFKKYLKFFSKQ